jgi:hypothetical protein
MMEESEMRGSRPDRCHCPRCLQGIDHPDGRYHRELIAFLGTLNDEQRRLFAAVESRRLGLGGVARVAAITGLSKTTVVNGRQHLALLLEGRPFKKAREVVGGRPQTEAKYPAIMAAVEELLSDEVAGSPDGEERWMACSPKTGPPEMGVPR